MIHPLSWSVDSVLGRVRKNKLVMLPEDKHVYSMLPVQGRIVLDLGAYDGDSARLFLKLGARKVICVEFEPKLVERMKIKFAAIMDRIEIRPRKVIPSDLANSDYDVIKWDLKG